MLPFNTFDKSKRFNKKECFVIQKNKQIYHVNICDIQAITDKLIRKLF